MTAKNDLIFTTESAVGGDRYKRAVFAFEVKKVESFVMSHTQPVGELLTHAARSENPFVQVHGLNISSPFDFADMPVFSAGVH